MDMIIKNLADLTKAQLQLLLEDVEVTGKGTCTLPPLDLDAIKSRADELDPKSQLKADIYMLLIEIDRLRGE